MSKHPFTFDFDFGSESRDALLQQAREAFSASDLGEETRSGVLLPAQRQGIRLLNTLPMQVARFGRVQPLFYEVEEKYFTRVGLPIPADFQDATKENRLYWVQLPLTLKGTDELVFNKLQCAIEFNPEEADPKLRPRARALLPNKRFVSLMDAKAELTLVIGEHLDFEVESGEINLQVGDKKLVGEAGVSLQNGGKVGLGIGPFNYKLRRAEIDHSSLGTEYAAWTVKGKQYFMDASPEIVVVVQIPKTVKQLTLAAAIQVSSAVSYDDNLLKFLVQKVASYFKAGAPIPDETSWTLDVNG